MTTTVRIAVLLLLWAILFAPIFPGLLDAWLRHSNNSHGLLVPLVSLYLIWQRRAELQLVERSSSLWGALLLVSSLVLYLISYAGDVVVTMRLALVGSLVGLILYVLGPALLRIVLFPLLFLLFMIPVPDSVVGSVSFPLQLMATSAAASLIGLLSIPVWQEGNMLYFVQTQLEVAEACSGLRSLVALTMLSVLLAYLLDSPRSQRWLLALSALPVAITANILRVSATGVLAHFYGAEVARGFVHTFSGIAVFLFGLALLIGEYALLSAYAGRSGRV